MHRAAPVLVALAFAAGCAGPPGLAPSKPTRFYEYQPNLAAKAEAHLDATAAMVNSSGMLLYRPYLPWGEDQRGQSNYHRSHDIADAPAWHGMFMQALAYKWASGGGDEVVRLDRLVDGIANNIGVTGVPGLLSRSYMGDYDGPRLPWMTTKEQRPTKYWTQGPSGYWYRNGLAKNHLNMAVCGLAVPLALHRQGKIALPAALEAKLSTLLVMIVKHLRDGGWRIRDADGGFTEFGDLRPGVGFAPDWPDLDGLPNGFNRMLVLNMLVSGAPYDAELLALYEDLAPKWGPGIKHSMSVVGEAVKAVGHYKLGKPSYSDMQAFATAATCFMLQENRREIVRNVRGGLHGLWEYMRWENNAPFNLAYYMMRPQDARMPAILRVMRHFPGRDGKKAWHFEKKETDDYQPIENRPPNTNYWKSSPFRLAKWVGPGANTHPETGDEQVYAGADYLYAYHLGRMLEALPAE